MRNWELVKILMNLALFLFSKIKAVVSSSNFSIQLGFICVSKSCEIKYHFRATTLHHFTDENLSLGRGRRCHGGLIMSQWGAKVGTHMSPSVG